MPGHRQLGVVVALLASACGGGGAGAIDAGDASTLPVDARPSASDAAPAPGSWDDPIVITALPFTHSADTSLPAADLVDFYSPCAPETDESGGEFVYQLTVSETTALIIAVDDVSGDDIDIDVHLLSAASPSSCIARDNLRIDQEVDPGTYTIVADTWVNGALVALAGAYTITVDEDGGGGDCLSNPISCGDDDTPLVNGVPSEPAGVGGCPAGMVAIAGFCIDRYEAMLVLVGGDDSLAPFSPYANPGAARVRALSAPGMVPQGYITQVEAAAACGEAGKRLCSDSEWLRACQGPSTTTYPYGDSLQPGVCNDDRTCHPVVQYFETTADWIWSELGHPCINQLPAGLATTAAHGGCETAEGAFDMMGNLHEWTADPAGTFRGGFYVDTVVNGPGCLYRTTAHNIYHWDYSTGFRCCADL